MEQEKDTIGVVLVNLGGPDNLEDVKPFLISLFSDREIIKLPLGRLFQPFWAWLMASLRARKARRNYAAIGGGSPQLRITQQQADGLQAYLNKDQAGRFKVTIAMRYWPPLTDDALDSLERSGVRQVVALTMYPHYSSATTGSSLNELERAITRRDKSVKLSVIDRWYGHPLYLDLMAQYIDETITAVLNETGHEPVVLFSAHGLPQRFVDAGDPYVQEVCASMEQTVARLPSPTDCRLCYQSKVGPVKWIGPSTDAMLREVSKEGIRHVVVVPMSFVSDHIETLQELDQEYAHLAQEMGFITYRRVRTLNDDPKFIAVLADLITTHLAERESSI